MSLNVPAEAILSLPPFISVIMVLNAAENS